MSLCCCESWVEHVWRPGVRVRWGSLGRHSFRSRRKLRYRNALWFLMPGEVAGTAAELVRSALRGRGGAVLAPLLLLCFLARASGAGSLPANPEPPIPIADETRGVWMWPSDVRPEGAEAVAERLAQHHINKVFFLVKGTGGRVCYPSQVAPGSPSGQDALKAILDACHKRHIEVHAWYMFNADTAWGKKHPDDAMWRAGKPDAWALGPERAGDAQVIHICPLSQGYLSYIKSQVQEVLDRYPVDGIHLDGIRYTHAQYCFCPRHQAIAATNGIHLDKVRQAVYDTFYSPEKKPDYYFSLYRAGDRDVTAWVGLREKEIDQTVKEIRDVVKAKNPSLVVSASFMPEGGERDDTFALCHYAQNYASAGSQLDYILPMTYHKTFGHTPAWVVQVTQNAAKKSHRPVYSGIQAFGRDTTKVTVDGHDKAANDPEGASSQDLREAVLAVEKQGVKGFVLFRYGSLTDQMWEALP